MAQQRESSQGKVSFAAGSVGDVSVESAFSLLPLH